MSRRPDTFIVGFPKCATTSLYEYLKGHPDIYMSPAKEPRYFAQARVGGPHLHDLVYPDDERRYLNLFAEARDQLTQWLAGERAAPPDWPGLAIFEPALPHRARHASIRLAFEAAAEAAAHALQARAA